MEGEKFTNILIDIADITFNLYKYEYKTSLLLAYSNAST